MLLADRAIFKKYLQCSLELPKPILKSLSSLRYILKFKNNPKF